MKKLVTVLCCFICFHVYAKAIDITGLQAIGSIKSISKFSTGVQLDCADGSQVRIYVLARDLIRVRATFKHALSDHDHSWAVAKTDWAPVDWKLEETGESARLDTGEVLVVINRSPLLIEFRDSRTGRMLNSDERPMMHDAAGSRAPYMFDPKAGEYIAVSKKLGFSEHFFGLGEKAAHLDKRRDEFVNWNSDTPGYTEGKDPIYQTVPFYIGLQEGIAYGIFFDNSYRSYFDFGRSSQRFAAFAAEGGEINYYFFNGPSIRKILGRYADLTGHMPLPPLWALGNQQSRWSYYPETVASQVVDEYRKRDIPLDVIHLDIDYMQAYRDFTFDTTRFPDPKAMSDRFASKGVKIVAIVDPGVKYQPDTEKAQTSLPFPPHIELLPQDKSYYAFNDGLRQGFFQKRRNGEIFVPKVWPGDSVFVDFTLPAASKWWGDMHRAYTDNGIAGIWNDMNEPSDFVDQTGRNQMDVVSYDEGEKSTHAKNRNVFALLEARATYEGLERLQPDKRPYVITRAAYAGIQRYSTMWTGDTNSTWDSLAMVTPMLTSLGLSGQPFVGGDIGGFIGRGNGELLTRWYQIGFLSPFCRNHKTIDGYDQEPWRFGSYYEDIIRKYLKLRYRLMPFLYSSLEVAHRTGAPMFRPLVLNYQEDENTSNLDDEFMIGDDLLVAPVVAPGITNRLVYLPKGVWYDYWTGAKINGGTTVRAEAPLETVPMFVRGGAIIPAGPDMNYVGEKPADPITFSVYPDEKGAAATSLYEDDGTSPAYKTGAFRRTAVEFSSVNGSSTIHIPAPEGNFQVRPRRFVFDIRTSSTPSTVFVNGKPLHANGLQDSSDGWTAAQGSVQIRVADVGVEQTITLK